MQNNSRKRILGFVVILIVAIYYFFFGQNKPYQVLTPKSYVTGTTVSLYKSTPPSFPSGIILENKPLNSANTVTTPDGKIQYTVSYISDKTMSDLSLMYQKSLTQISWKIPVSVNSGSLGRVATIKANKDTQILLITISPLKNKGTMVTFQYNK